MLKFFSVFIFFVSCFANANGNYQGYWTRGCDAPGYGSVYIENNNDINIVVNSQFIVKAKATIENKKMTLVLVEPLDNAIVGNSILWSKISLDRPIAIIVFESEERAKLHWFGFFDKSVMKYVWSKEADLIRDYHPNQWVPLVKCVY